MQDAYFQQLTECLKQSGNGLQQLVIDIERYEYNLQLMRSLWPVACIPRLVVKSLANSELLRLAMQRLNTRALMVFHLPHISSCFELDSQVNILLGKPMPIQAVVTHLDEIYTNLPKIQWLIDSTERLKQYLGLAIHKGCRFSISLEIDVGLHRGGFQVEQDFVKALQLIRQHPEHLQLTGLMGYDVHIAKLPAPIFKAAERYRISQQRYADFIQSVQTYLPECDVTQLSLNGGGSQTLLHHFKQTVCNDLAFGSVLLKPTDFNLPILQDFQPALWIASPILKRMEAFQLPGLEMLSRLHPTTAICIYGGYWRGECVYPKGAKPHPLYGRSTNQELWQLPKNCAVKVDDYVFFQPVQSESTLQQFHMSYFYHQQVLKGALNFRE